MPDPFDVLVAEDFGGGIYRGREAPPGTVYTAQNALVDDEGQLFRRGMSAYYSASNAAQTLRQLWVLFMRGPATNRVLMTGSSALYALDGSLAPVVIGGPGATLTRPASFGDFAVFGLGTNGVLFYGGSLKTSTYSTGTVTVTAGSATVTGAGTSWTANVDAGMLLRVGSTMAVVLSVDSNTQVTLTAPWSGSTAAGAAYEFTPVWAEAFSTLPTIGGGSYVAGGSGLLLLTLGNRVYFTLTGTVGVNDYHELPASVSIIGIESRGTSALVFTTGGVWTIENLYLDAIDDFGNIQRPVEQVLRDLVLWDDDGIAAWDASVVVPAIEDVYLLGPDGGLTVLSEGIRPLYRSYVKLGYQAGLASVHRGHYFLPVMNGTTLVNVLVCRLDRPYQSPNGRALFPWTSWSGHASGAAYAPLVSETTRSPKLLGISGARVTDLSECMEVTSVGTQDANSTTPEFTVDVPLPSGRLLGLRNSTASFIRSQYETLEGTPAVTAATAVGDPATASIDAATLKRGGGASDGTDYSSWAVHRKGTQWMVRLASSTQTRKLLLRRIELTVRRNGR